MEAIGARSAAENRRRCERLMAHIEARKLQAEAEAPPARMTDPVEQWYFDNPKTEVLAERIVAADRFSAGYSDRVVEAIMARRRRDTDEVKQLPKSMQ